MHVYCIQAALFILVALLANAFPHLNMTPPILFISHICGRESKQCGREERVSETERGVYVCACAHVHKTHTKSEWRESVPADDVTFSTPLSLCSPLPLADVQQACSHCLLHCNLSSFMAKQRNQLTSFSPRHLFTSAVLKQRQAPISEEGTEKDREEPIEREYRTINEEEITVIERDGQTSAPGWAHAVTLPVLRLQSHWI